MLRNRLAKIVATLGPASNTAEAITSLYESGADVFRINAAYSNDADNAALIGQVREAISDDSKPVGTIWDLPGLKMRIGGFKDGSATLVAGSTFTLDQSPEDGDETRVYLPFPEAFAHTRVGDVLRLDDGRLTLRVTEVTLFRLSTTVVAGGELSANKAILFPNVPIPTAEVSNRDAESLSVALEAGADWIAATANGSLDVVRDLKRRIGGKARLMVKIDSKEMLDQLEAVLELADGLFLARGDLGSRMPVEMIPNAQKDTILAAREAGKPAIVAAQMLESMVGDPTPTRAEASDVCQAIYDGADAVTLSAETAVGHYPIDSRRDDGTADHVSRDGRFRYSRGPCLGHSGGRRLKGRDHWRGDFQRRCLRFQRAASLCDCRAHVQRIHGAPRGASASGASDPVSDRYGRNPPLHDGCLRCALLAHAIAEQLERGC